MVRMHAKTCLKLSLMVFLGFLTLLVPIKPKWGPNCAADVPVRGPRVQERHQHNWDPIWAAFSLTRESRTFKALKKLPGSKNITVSYISLNHEHQQGSGGLGFRMIASEQGGQRPGRHLPPRPKYS